MTRCFLLSLALFLGACATPKISPRPVTRSEPAATALVAKSQAAHGADAFRKIHTVELSYDGKWAAVGPKFQPILADTSFRGGSRERYDLRRRTVRQEHTGVAGRKEVRRAVGEVAVTYNGVRSNDQEVLRAAALVADAYTLFLLGPFYFDRPGVVLVTAGEGTVDRQPCDQVLAILTPGFGFAKEDRVLLSIDRATRQLRRVRMTLNGLDSTIGAEVDITFRDFRRIDGVLWPTDFDERIRVPFDLHAHHWKLVSLTTN